MKKLRYFVPIFGAMALLALFFKLPEAPNLFGLFGCKSCSSADPYLPLLGAGYFAALIATAILFPAWPTSKYARAGLIGSILFGLVLTYHSLPDLCVACVIGHSCNVAIWGIWAFTPVPKNVHLMRLRERLCLLLFLPISVTALFSGLNLTFKNYSFKPQSLAVVTGLRVGDPLPTFGVQTVAGAPFSNAGARHALINFISLDCSHCKEQMQILNIVAEQANASYRMINVSTKLPHEEKPYDAKFEWVEDKHEELETLFRVSGYPTLFVIGSDGKISHVFPGVTDDMQAQLANILAPQKQ